MNLQTPLIPSQNLNNFQLTPLNVSGDGLQPFLGLIGQILLIKIILKKLSNCKQYLLKFVNMFAKKKSFQSQFTILECLRFGGQKIK
jgi:hypothetical protein